MAALHDLATFAGDLTVDRLAAMHGRVHLQAHAVQQLQRHFAVDQVVFGQQDPPGTTGGRDRDHRVVLCRPWLPTVGRRDTW